MASRFTENKPLTRCYNPVNVYRNGEFKSFPCGRCPACLLDKSNNLSMRLANEVETTPFNIFFTLTYSNKYLPKLFYCNDPSIDLIPFYYSNHFENIRFDGKKDVRRIDNVFISCVNPYYLPISNYTSDKCIGYSSKRDIILWLKLLRTDIDKHFNLDLKDETEKRYYRFRYFIISEYGPTTHRPHIHGTIHTYSQEVAEFLIRSSLYQNWQMCDKSLFDQYTHYCDGGAAGYVTNYLNSPSNLPTLLKNESVRTFRLSSKNPAIGFNSFEKAEVYEKIFAGINQYSKSVPRLASTYLFCYPSDFAHRLFPKCREYSLLSYKRLHYVYGFLWRNVIKNGFSYNLCNNFIRKKWYPADVTAAQKTYQFCLDTGFSVDCFLYLVDMYFYKEAMFALQKFYEWQEKNFDNPVAIAFSYTNFQDRVHSFNLDSNERKNTLILFSHYLGFDIYEYVSKNSLSYDDPVKDSFRLEVDDILNGMLKMPKFNEQFGFAPHII